MQPAVRRHENPHFIEEQEPRGRLHSRHPHLPAPGKVDRLRIDRRSDPLTHGREGRGMATCGRRPIVSTASSSCLMPTATQPASSSTRASAKPRSRGRTKPISNAVWNWPGRCCCHSKGRVPIAGTAEPLRQQVSRRYGRVEYEIKWGARARPERSPTKDHPT